MTEERCGARDCPRGVTAGFAICAGCRAAIRRDLRALPALYRECAGRLAWTSQGISQRVKGTRPRGINLNEAALRARSGVLDVLASWCSLVTQQRRVTGPTARTAPDLAGLDGQLDWLARHPAAGDFAAEVRQLAAAAAAAAERDTSDARPLGPCGRDGCRHIVYLRRDHGALGQVGCDAGHIWRPHEWLALSASMRPSAAVAGQPAERVA